MSEPEGDLWETPPSVIRGVTAVLSGIDLDPASSEGANKNVKATRYYTRDDDGLTMPWDGKVFVNPPYSKVRGESQAGLFVRKMFREYHAGRMTEGTILTNVCTDAKWFRVMWQMQALCFVYGRLHFTHPTLTADAPRYASVLGYLGTLRGIEEFNNEFAPLGEIIIKPWYRF